MGLSEVTIILGAVLIVVLAVWFWMAKAKRETVKAEMEVEAETKTPEAAEPARRAAKLYRLSSTRMARILPQNPYDIVSVFYATDRSVTGEKQPHLYYGKKRGDLQVGICKVSVPRDHRLGELETPFIRGWGRWLRVFWDPERHVVLHSVEPKEEGIFFQELGREILKSDKRDAFVFIHGYNVTFEDTCRRAAQLAVDLKFTGAPITYSWPSSGRLMDYIKDETDIEWSTANFERFILMVVEKTEAEIVHLIAHSMGNRALVNGLARIVEKQREPRGPVFNQVVLTAPDIDSGVFRNLASAIQYAADGITLYASSNDEALNLSKSIHGYPRAGEAGPHLIVVPGIDTIDVSQVDTSFVGHSYYGDNRSVITDLYELLISGTPPGERFGLRPQKWESLIYWEFRP